jgi:orotidine-5'-phosphate decarboxylase
MKLLYEMVLKKVSEWGTDENLMFVVGATQADEFANIRKIVSISFLSCSGCRCTRWQFERDLRKSNDS